MFHVERPIDRVGADGSAGRVAGRSRHRWGSSTAGTARSRRLTGGTTAPPRSRGGVKPLTSPVVRGDDPCTPLATRVAHQLLRRRLGTQRDGIHPCGTNRMETAGAHTVGSARRADVGACRVPVAEGTPVRPGIRDTPTRRIRRRPPLPRITTAPWTQRPAASPASGREPRSAVERQTSRGMPLDHGAALGSRTRTTRSADGRHRGQTRPVRKLHGRQPRAAGSRHRPRADGHANSADRAPSLPHLDRGHDTAHPTPSEWAPCERRRPRVEPAARGNPNAPAPSTSRSAPLPADRHPHGPHPTAGDRTRPVIPEVRRPTYPRSEQGALRARRRAGYRSGQGRVSSSDR